jgi:transcriptional regulator with XRE-family HTH domain
MAHVDEERKALGERLAKARREAGYTLDTAATALTGMGYPIGRGAIGAWETGRNMPDVFWFERLAMLYDSSIEYLAFGRTASGLSDEVAKIAASVDSFTGENRRRVLLLVREVLNLAQGEQANEGATDQVTKIKRA